MQKSEKVFVAGHRGMVGSALTRALEAAGFTNLIKRDRSQLDLGDSAAVACPCAFSIRSKSSRPASA